ncbi:MAG TPA: nicotinate-nucleotide adenylyltransferase [Gammaproteobacteria bacterium]|nr:nicotinate-nucleotide adenylyltransferase [Gammaproteobacteria bacterium]
MGRRSRVEAPPDRFVMQAIGIFGGTFDPVHYGHLRTGFELIERLALSELRFIPCAHPPHRPAPRTPGRLRLRMLQAAIRGEPRFVADGRELERPGPSYTVETLESLRADLPGRALCLVLGMDAFLGLPGWYRWQQLLELAHIVVAHRPGWQVPDTGTLGELIRARRTASAAELAEGAGRIYVEPVTQLEISSTELRAGIQAGVDPRYLVPDLVRQIILDTECYAEETTERINA